MNKRVASSPGAVTPVPFPRNPRRAAAALARTLATTSGSAADWFRYGELLAAERHFAAAAIAFLEALERSPANSKYVRALAAALSHCRRYEEAIALRERLQFPNEQDVAGLADDLRYLHAFARAIAVVDTAEADGRAGDHARVVRGQAKLFLGDYAGGFADMEHRFAAGMARAPVPTPRVAWDGSPNAGLRLLVVPDQGLGDDLMMARFLPRLAAAGLACTFLARPPLQRLLAVSPLGCEVAGSSDDVSRFDAWCAIGSLPHLLRLSAAPPRPAPLAVPETAARRGRALAAPFAGVFKVGICWTGNPDFPRNRQRSIEPAMLLPLLELPGTRFFSLCTGAARAALDAAALAGVVVDACRDDRDLADTAGLIEQLDLVISTDTSIVHLAASLGKPVWNLLPHESFWQYGTTGSSTPWYPTMRLLRQPLRGDWHSVVEDARTALDRLVQARPRGTNRSS